MVALAGTHIPQATAVLERPLEDRGEFGGAAGASGTEVPGALGAARVVIDTSASTSADGWSAVPPKEATDGVGRTILDEALGALQGVALSDSVTAEDAVRASRLLRAVAVERRVSAPRLSGVAVLVSDALLFTQVEGFSRAQRAPLREALRLLASPFVPQADEGMLVDHLLDNGWDVTASLDPDVFSVTSLG